MNIPIPEKGIITVYSKSGCTGCIKVKKLLEVKKLNFIIINCDDFIFEDKASFLKLINQLSGSECKTFPMVFDYQTFIGGYKETLDYLDKLLEFDYDFSF
jgi:glutaredoxin